MELFSRGHNTYHYLLRNKTGAKQTQDEHRNQADAILLSMQGLEEF